MNELENMEEITVRKSDGRFAKGVLTGCLFCALLGLLVVCLMSGRLGDGISELTRGENGAEDTVVMSDVEKKLESLQEIVDMYYYYEDKAELANIEDAIYKAYISGLDDKYTTYYTEEELDSMMENLNGEYCGIGSVVSQNEQGEVVIVLPYEGAPAAEAGLQPGDVLLSIDKESLSGMDLEAAVSLVKGEEGSKAVFEVRREEEIFEVEITRRKVDIPTVDSEMREGNIGYIIITSFDLTTTKQYKQAIDELLEQGAKGIVFDLRDNGGGSLDVVVDMLDYLLPKELLLYIEDKDGNRENYYAKDGCVDESIPMAVIINGNSASASEVFTGALQDYNRAKVFGTKSYGKGVVQNLIPLSDGSGIKLTIGSYFTPTGRNFNDNGIDPDVVVELPTEEEAYTQAGYLKEGYDTQLEAAVSYIKEQIAE